MSFNFFLHMLLLAISLLLIGFDFIVLASNNISFLQHSKSLCHDHEKSALLRFKQSFLIDCDKSTSTLAYPKVNSWHESDDCCKWDGVECDENTGLVTRLDLSSSCLYGNFPRNSTLFSLDNLLELNLADNYFNYSEIPYDISHLYKLTHLNLSASVFSGIIPSEISRLSSLSVLDLSMNGDYNAVVSHFYMKFHDMSSLEKLVANATQLTQLILDYVNISSTVPLILNNLTSLEVLSLVNCYLFGEFPVNIFLLPNLEDLSLYFNPEIGGYLPNFQSDSLLRYLDLGGTMFSGGLPSSLGNLRSLNFLRLEECEFSGTIPSSIGNLTELTTLSLSNNLFSGEIPISITKLTCLTTLRLSDFIVHELEIISSWLSKLNKLTVLMLKNMNLDNKVLHPLQNLTRLSFLDLSNNQITGPLPHWLMNLTQIAYLNVLSNQLQGPIPLGISHLTSLQWLLMSFNNSAVVFDTFLKLPNLSVLQLVGVTPTFPSNISTNTSMLQLSVLSIESCNLRKFPEFLRHQVNLQGLLLSGSNITGKIPQWLVNITKESLINLDLSNNLLSGFEVPQAFLPWKNLVLFNCNGNKFRGPLLFPPKSIQIYKASNNLFFGAIPKNFCNGPLFIYLDLSNNKLSGQIPSCVVHQLSSTLQVLNLRGNNFGGNVPPTFSMSCKLKMINLSENRLEGKLPRSIGNCLMLEVLDVGRNLIRDSFPKWLGALTKLHVLVLRHNNFHGRIIAPFHGHHFQGLHIIDLSYNLFTGNLPTRYIQNWLVMTISNEDMSSSSKSLFRYIYGSGDFIEIYDEPYNYGITISNKGVETFYSRILTVFRVIDFSSNEFSGRIPEIIGNLKGLEALNLSNNNLVGDIPSTLANVTDLEALDLSQNMISGEIPQDLTMLTYLEIFNVSHNRLVGPIPQGKQFSTFDASSFGGNLALCGAQLFNKCENTNSLPPSSPPKSISRSNKPNDETTIGWIVKSLGWASGFVIGYVIGKIYVADKHHDWFVKIFARRGRSKTKVMRSSPRHRVRN